MSETEMDLAAEAERLEEAEESVADGDRPEWLPEKFQTPEALVASYKQLENLLRERGTRLNELEQQFAELSELVDAQAA